jgi:uncharacterized membrane protein
MAVATFDTEIRRMELDAPWRWLAAGWRDMTRVPGVSFSYGVAICAASWALTLFLVYFDLVWLFLPLAAGFTFIGPMLAVGLYEASRRLEAGLPVGIFQVAFVATRSPTQIAFLGLILMLFMLAWVRIATLLFALFFGQTMPPLAKFVPMLLYTADGAAFLAIGTITGAALAFAVFAISAVSVPLLMARDSDAVTAIVISLRAVAENFWPMVVWAWLIAVLTAIGIATLFVGLVFTFPLIGHATWHAYRELVPDDGR